MSNVVLIFGGIFGGLAVILGALGAHALKKKFSPEHQNSFETGIKYQMYHALILILCGRIFTFSPFFQELMAWCFIVGTILFSFSIYGLTLSSSLGKKWRFLGPVTPLGGLLLVLGWALFVFNIAASGYTAR